MPRLLSSMGKPVWFVGTAVSLNYTTSVRVNRLLLHHVFHFEAWRSISPNKARNEIRETVSVLPHFTTVTHRTVGFCQDQDFRAHRGSLSLSGCGLKVSRGRVTAMGGGWKEQGKAKHGS